MAKLTVAGVRSAKPGRHADGDGLYLLVKPSGGRSWLLRVQVDGRRRDIGLGSVDILPRLHGDLIDIPLLHRKRLSLAEARDKCAVLRKAAEAGLDPIIERDRDRRGIPTFEQAAIACHTALRAQWTPRHEASFLSSLQRHAYPKLGGRRVSQIAASDIQAALEPIWTTTPDMARKVRQRIGQVLDFSHSKNWRLTGAPGKAVTIGLPKQLAGNHHPAMPFADVPAFIAEIVAHRETVGRMALLFTIYTAARSGEVRNARWSHIDFALKLWIRPSELMKMQEGHAVTLNPAAIAVLERATGLRRNLIDDLIFPSTKGTPLSDMTLSKILRDAKRPFTVHGFRSSFRDWAAEKMSGIPDPVAEAALAHTVSDKVIRAYKRTTFIDLRRQLLDAWSSYLFPGDNHGL